MESEGRALVQLGIKLDGLEKPVRDCIIELLNLIQKQAKELEKLREENIKLRKENARLQGKKPKFGGKPESGKAGKRKHLSSEKERKQAKSKEANNKPKSSPLQVDERRFIPMDRTTLPSDVQCKGKNQIVIQDLKVSRHNIAFEREKLYSPSEGKTYCPPLPPEYQGHEYGPGVRSLALVLYHACGVTEPKLKEFFETAGLQISSAQISNLLIQGHEAFHKEKAELFDAGLQSSAWQHMDDTGTRVDGKNWHCHMVCNPYYTIYVTRAGKDRETVVEVLRNERELVYRVNEQVLQAAREQRVSCKWISALEQMPQDWQMDAAEFGLLLWELDCTEEPTLQKVSELCLIQGYQHATDMAVVQALLTDGARTFAGVTVERGLCWIHEGRLYKKLTPVVQLFQEELEEIRSAYWEYYGQLQAYKTEPTEQEAQRLSERFDEIFSTPVSYQELAQRLSLTKAKKQELLLVLRHPEIPLHNNPVELEARFRVRKRDISFGPRSQAGLQAWDTFQSLICTAKKLGVNVLQYFEDRVCGWYRISKLADLVRQKAQQFELDASWPKSAGQEAMARA